MNKYYSCALITFWLILTLPAFGQDNNPDVQYTATLQKTYGVTPSHIFWARPPYVPLHRQFVYGKITALDDQNQTVRITIGFKFPYYTTMLDGVKTITVVAWDTIEECVDNEAVRINLVGQAAYLDLSTQTQERIQNALFAGKHDTYGFDIVVKNSGELPILLAQHAKDDTMVDVKFGRNCEKKDILEIIVEDPRLHTFARPIIPASDGSMSYFFLDQWYDPGLRQIKRNAAYIGSI